MQKALDDLCNSNRRMNEISSRAINSSRSLLELSTLRCFPKESAEVVAHLDVTTFFPISCFEGSSLGVHSISVEAKRRQG